MVDCKRLTSSPDDQRPVVSTLKVMICISSDYIERQMVILDIIKSLLVAKHDQSSFQVNGNCETNLSLLPKMRNINLCSKVVFLEKT